MLERGVKREVCEELYLFGEYLYGARGALLECRGATTTRSGGELVTRKRVITCCLCFLTYAFLGLKYYIDRGIVETLGRIIISFTE